MSVACQLPARQWLHRADNGNAGAAHGPHRYLPLVDMLGDIRARLRSTAEKLDVEMPAGHDHHPAARDPAGTSPGRRTPAEIDFQRWPR